MTGTTIIDAPTSATIKPRKWLTHAQKIAIIKYADDPTHVKAPSSQKLADWATREFKLTTKLSRSTISRILSARDSLLKTPELELTRKRPIDGRVAAFDAEVLRILDAMEGKVKAITGHIVRKVAERAAASIGITQSELIKFSNGWLQKFQHRYNISLKRKHGEAGSVDEEAVRQGREKMQRLTDPYARSDIYNMDETAYYYMQEPATTLSRRKKVAGKKKDKRRLTMALATNADGSDKLPPLFIGTAAQPRPLRGHDVFEELGVVYKNSPKGWMNSAIFEDWLRRLDERMRGEHRNILLLVDNVSSHKRPIEPPLTNVRLEFLPKNQTSWSQPLDQGIIANAKQKVTAILVERSVDQFFANGHDDLVDVYTALEVGMQAWGQVTKETISNCWHHAGILSDRSKIDRLLNPLDRMSLILVLK